MNRKEQDKRKKKEVEEEKKKSLRDFTQIVSERLLS